MSDEAIINDTLRFMNLVLDHPQRIVNLKTTVWWNFDLRKQEHLRRLLFERTLVNQDMNNKWQFRLTAQGDVLLGNVDKELRNSFLRYIQRQPNIELFMVEHFIKPNPKSKSTTHKTDTGVNFLKDLKSDGLIDFDKEDLLHISNDWYVDNPPTKKRWFDTVDESHPFSVYLTELGKNYFLLEEALPKSTPITTDKNAQIQTTNKGSSSKSIWKNDLIVFLGYPLLALMIGTILLKLLGVI